MFRAYTFLYVYHIPFHLPVQCQITHTAGQRQAWYRQKCHAWEAPWNERNMYRRTFICTVHGEKIWDIFSVFYVWYIYIYIYTGEAGDLRRNHAHYDVIVMSYPKETQLRQPKIHEIWFQHCVVNSLRPSDAYMHQSVSYPSVVHKMAWRRVCVGLTKPPFKLGHGGVIEFPVLHVRNYLSIPHAMMFVWLATLCW